MGLVKAWRRFLIDREVVRPEVLARNITIKLPELLPRALDPEGVKQLLAVVAKVRDRTLVLLLLRSGMRIGEVLSATVNDLDGGTGHVSQVSGTSRTVIERLLPAQPQAYLCQ